MNHLITALRLVLAEQDLYSLARSIMSEFFSGLQTLEGKPLPLPHFKIVRHTGAKWLGRCTFKISNPVTTTIEIQKSIMNVPESLDRVLCHELIHHADFMTHERARSKYTREGHFGYFQEMADKINAKRGKDYVTEKSDVGYVQENLGQEILLLIYPYGNSQELGYSIAVRPSAKQKESMQRYVDRYAAKIVKTKDNQWANGPRVGSGKIAVPKGEEQQEVLRKLYEEAA